MVMVPNASVAGRSSRAGLSTHSRVGGTVSRMTAGVQRGLGFAALALSAPAWAVKDMVGGPGVNQVNLTQGVTKIAADQH